MNFLFNHKHLIKNLRVIINTLEEMEATASNIDADVTSPIGESSLSSVLIIIEPVGIICVCCIDGEVLFNAVIISLVASVAEDM